MGVIIVVGGSEDEVDVSLAGRFLLFKCGVGVGVGVGVGETGQGQREENEKGCSQFRSGPAPIGSDCASSSS
jgi:hypothetical protein